MKQSTETTKRHENAEKSAMLEAQEAFNNGLRPTHADITNLAAAREAGYSGKWLWNKGA